MATWCTASAVSGFIYPIIGHWVWGPDGWLATMNTPFRDFAGSTVVHTIGGMIALAGAIALGPRIGRKFKRDGGGMPPGHDMILASLGGVILWFGWYGFNPGSTLSAMDFGGIGRVATNTTLAACAGGLVAMFYVYPRSHKWDTGITINGFLAGLVAITCPCYWVSPLGSLCIGAIAAVVMVCAVDFVEWLRVDDPIGAVAVHGCVRDLRHAQLGPVRHGPVRTSRSTRCRHLDTGRGPLLRRRFQAARRAGAREFGSDRCDVLDRARRDVRGEVARDPAGLARRSSSVASTFTSTVRRRITPSSRTWGTR